MKLILIFCRGVGVEPHVGDSIDHLLVGFIKMSFVGFTIAADGGHHLCFQLRR